MPYVSIRDVRMFNGWHPINVSNEGLSGSGREYRTSKKPIVDYDYDGQVVDDVHIDEGYEVESVDADRGIITFTSAPSGYVTADYYWHPISDAEIQLAIAAAELEIKALTGINYEPHTAIEHHRLYYGDQLYMSEPIISIISIIDKDSGRTLSSSEYELLPNGIVKLKTYYAGRVTSPWFLPSIYSFEVTYQAGYSEIPATVRHATLLIATYNILLRIARQISFSEDYSGISATFKSPEELNSRMEMLAKEIERVKASLPRRVAKA